MHGSSWRECLLIYGVIHSYIQSTEYIHVHTCIVGPPRTGGRTEYALIYSARR